LKDESARDPSGRDAARAEGSGSTGVEHEDPESTTPELIRVAGHQARRRFGQNFLVAPGIQRRIAEALGGDPEAPVLEIGPGKGALTRFLVDRGGPLFLVEIDRDLAAAHRARYAAESRIRVLEHDILKVPLTEFAEDPSTLRVIGNIPYNITTPILFHLLERPRPAEILLMVQQEVADRILAAPGTSDFGALTVGVRTVADVSLVLRVPSGAFVPRPKVDSAVIRIVPITPEPLTLEEEQTLRLLTRSLFQWRRKQIGKSLRDHPELGVPVDHLRPLLDEVGVAATDRPETLSPERFVTLARGLVAAGIALG
jgi:16S rRNA (adenine1518-N6/adenine1519-N6)-dimethyltransferase